MEIEAYQRLFHLEGHENHFQIADSLQKKPCFFKVIRGVLGRLVNFSITSRFLLGRPVFPDYLSVSYDYAEMQLRSSAKGDKVKSCKHQSYECINICK